MLSSRAFLFVSLFLALCLSAPAFGQNRHMQMLTSFAGWVLAPSANAPNNLYMTFDAGGNWMEINPPILQANVRIADVHFKDSRQGWALLSARLDDTNEWRFDVASTVNSGTTWAMTPVKIAGLIPKTIPLNGQGRIDFVDQAHGWLNLDVAISSNIRVGILLATNDGGKTWTRQPSGAGGAIRFVTVEDGWVARAPEGRQLYATHDAGKSWGEVKLKAPPEAGAALYPLYGLPVFLDSKRGFLPVTFAAPKGSRWAQVLFATGDGGRSWSPFKTLAGLEAREGSLPPSAVTGSGWLTFSATESALTLIRTPLGANASGGAQRTSAAVPNLSPPISEVSFVSATEGWVRVSTALLATTDGGVTWVDISPWKKPTMGPIPEPSRP
jgi:photosystem II stability/assembly factor-like uncharacterized protein